MLVHYLKAPHRDPSVVYPQIDEEVFCAVIRSCEKVEQGFMVDFQRVFVEHDDQLQVHGYQSQTAEVSDVLAPKWLHLSPSRVS